MKKYLFIFGLVVYSGFANACIATVQSNEKVFEEAQKIFIGKLTKAELIEDNPIYMRLRLTYLVLEGFKGNLSENEVVYTSVGIASCGLGPTGFYSDQLIFTGASLQAVSPPSFSLTKKLTPSGVVYTEDNMKWIELLRAKNL